MKNKNMEINNNSKIDIKTRYEKAKKILFPISKSVSSFEYEKRIKVLSNYLQI